MRTKSKIQSVALFMIVLVLMLPVAFAQNMSDLNQTIAAGGVIPLEAVVPSSSKDKYITIEGTTAPDARLEYYIGPTKIKVSRAKSDGTFTTTRVPLIKKGDNDLLIKATVEDKAAQKSFTINYDPEPPNLKVGEIPEFTTRTSLQVHGDVTEPVTIKYASYPKKDEDAPPEVGGLEIRELKKNQVTMVWTPSDAADLLEYAVYRDGVRVGVARSAIYVDNDAASGKEYTYRVAAVDTSCNEGVKSAPQKALTPPGGDAAEEAGAVELSCAPTYQTLDTAVPFDLTFTLQAGGNIVEIIASDNAGNEAKVKKFVTVDIGPPQFIATNLDAIGTTYIPEITVRGNVSEKASVFVYVNDEKNPSHFGLTNDNGGFEIPVKLRQDVEVSTGSATELDTGVGWKNKIKLKAVDLAGQEVWYPSQQQSKEVVWAMCGYGAWLDFDIEDITPRTVNPRLMMQGIQQVGIPFTLTYIGGQDDADIAGVVNAIPVRISPDLEDAFDNDKITQPQVWIKPRPGERGVWDGYIQMNFAEWPVDQLELEGNKTEAAIEKAISDWRRGEFYEGGAAGAGFYLKPGCLNPALGCVKLYLELDIPLKEKNRIYDPKTMQERFEWKTVRQRNCVPVILEIDQVIPPDVIRKDTLKAVSDFFGKGIELIDKILDPLTTFTENMVYLCLGSTAGLFIAGLVKQFTCSKIYLKSGTDPEIAKAGLCEPAYKGTSKDELYGKCQDCTNAIQAYQDVLQTVYQPICDRISCPSAPTVQKYILEQKNRVKDISSNIKQLDQTAQDNILNEWGVNGKVYSGNSCGFYPDFISSGYTVSRTETPAQTAAATGTASSAGQQTTAFQCDDDTDCDLDEVCDKSKGICVPSTEIAEFGGYDAGEACRFNQECKPGLECRQGYCVAPGAAVQPAAPIPAGSVSEGGFCTKTDDCKPELICANNQCMTISTEEFEGYDEGHACTFTQECKTGLVCISGYCQKSSTPSGSFALDVVGAFATGSAIAGVDPIMGPEAAMDTGQTMDTGARPGVNKLCGIEVGSGPMGAGGKIGIKEIYEIYRGDYQNIKEKCTDPSFHPACPLCCGYEYMWEWNSACGIGNFMGAASYNKPDLDTFNELKESARLAAEKVGRGDDIGSPNVFNYLSGFCTSDGNPTPDVVRTGLNYDPKIQEAEENLMQVFVFPESGSGDSFKYRVYRGYLAKTFVIDSALRDSERSLNIKASDRYSFSKTLEAIKVKDLTRHFQNLGTDKEKADIAAFTKDLCDRKYSGAKDCASVAPQVFEGVKAHIGTVDDEYIIRPDASLINSVRCICLTAFKAYLEQWRQIAQAIKNCVDMVLLTGDGDEGMCRAMLSNYVCDLLWEVISCFANKWSKSSGKRVSADAGIGDVLGILTGAGSDISNDVQGRYGNTAMFNAMFNEKELVHGLCLLAFGMEYNLDVSAMVQQSVESVPVDTIVMGPSPAQARFIAWNPVTNPRGLTTWEYHFGLMLSAGSDINTRVKLKCSTGFDCKETDGFVGGECDCNKLGEEKIVSINPICKPAWKNRVNKGELKSYDCSYVVQQGKYRFDTMIFEYDRQDPGTKQTITETSEAEINRIGALPPAFCRFDTFSLAFRCKFGESPSGIQIERVEPQYKYFAGNTEVFAMDKDLDFELSIKQMMPEEDKDSGIKFLGYKVLNSDNKVVKELNPTSGSRFDMTHQLKTDGSYKESVTITAPQEGWQNYFAKGGGTGGSRYMVTPWSTVPAVQNKIKADPSKYIDGISIKATKDGKVVTPDSKKKFFADIKENTIVLYEAKAIQSRGSYVTSTDNVLGSREMVQAGNRYTYQYTDPVNNIQYEISFRLKSVESLDKAENTQFLIAYVAGTTSGDPCADKKPVTWKATFTSYDADKYGGVTDQKSVDPISGEVQEKTIPIQITCDTAANLKAKGAEPEAPPEKKYAIMEAKLIDAEGDENLLSLDKATKIIPGDYKLKVKTSSEEGLVILYENLGLDRTDKEHTYAWDLDLTELGKSNVTVKYVVNDKVEDKKNYVVEVVSPVEILREGEEPAISGIGTVTVGGKEVRPRATISVLPGKDQIITIEVAGDIDDILVKDITGADFATMAGIPPEFAGTMDIEPGKKYEFFVEVYKDKKLIDSDKYVIEGFNITPEIPTASLSMNDLSKDSKNPTQINPLVYDWLIIPSLSGAAKVNVVIYNSRKGFFTTSFGTAYDQTVEPRHVSYFAYDIDLTKESAYYIKADYLNSGGSVIQTEERYVETNPNQIQSVSLIPPAGMPDLPKGIIDPKQIAESNPAVLPYEYVLDVRTLSPGAVFCKIKGDSVVEEEFMPDQIAGTTHQLKADFQKLYTGDLVYTLTCSLKNVDNQLVSQWRAQFFDEQIITVGGKRVYCSIVNSCEDYTQYTTVEFCNEDVCNKFNKECKWLGTKCEHRPPLSCANVKECKDYGAFWEDCNANTCKLATSCFWAPISQQCMVKTA